MLLLEINDAEIVLARDGEVLYREPGVAVVMPRSTVFGREAWAASRVRPQQSHNEFWHRLNGDPVTPQGRGVANQADLVYLQLQEIRAVAGGDRPRVVIASPAATTAEQLSMLLGIANESGFEVEAIVDAAVAAGSQQEWTESCRVLDVSLQQASIAHLEQATSADVAVVRRTAVDEIPATGLAPLVEGWIDVVADRFVDGTRFDPLRIAETEQQVFDQLLAGIESGSPEFVIEVSHADVARRVSVSRHALAEKSRQRYELLASAVGSGGTLLATHRALRLPGLAAFLQNAGHEVLPLTADAVRTAVSEHAAHVSPSDGPGSRPTGARLVAALPARHGPAAAARTAHAPTHLLGGGVAIALAEDLNATDHPAHRPGSANVRFARSERGWSVVPEPDTSVSLNGSAIDFEHPAAAGDTIDCGGTTFQLIAVHPPQQRVGNG